MGCETRSAVGDAVARPPSLLDVLLADVERLDQEQLDQLAYRLGTVLDRLGLRTNGAAAPSVGWLNACQAAEYLGLSLAALYKHTAARTIPFEQDGPGCKLWFRTDELDAWRRGA